MKMQFKKMSPLINAPNRLLSTNFDTGSPKFLTSCTPMLSYRNCRQMRRGRHNGTHSEMISLGLFLSESSPATIS